MAYNQNGQYYYAAAPRQDNQYVDQYGRRIGGRNSAGNASQGYEAGMNSAGSQHTGMPYQQNYGAYSQGPGENREQHGYGASGMSPVQGSQATPALSRLLHIRNHNRG